MTQLDPTNGSQDGSTNPQASGSGGTGPEGNADTNGSPRPERVRKTHKTPEISDLLKSLSRGARMQRNESIQDRNKERAIDRLIHKDDFEFRDSDDESIITISDIGEEPPSPTSALTSAMKAVSPRTAKVLVNNFVIGSSSKRPREEDGETKPTKKPRKEITLREGMALPVAFHQHLRDLYTNGYYIPLSLFTNTNLRKLMSTAATVDMVKLNASTSYTKGLRLLDTAAFEQKNLKESDMDRGQWLEGAKNYIGFIGELEGRWQRRAATTGKAEANFPAILKADIELRMQYNAQPFTFEESVYTNTLNGHIVDMKVVPPTTTRLTHPLRLVGVAAAAVLGEAAGAAMGPFKQAVVATRRAPSAFAADDAVISSNSARTPPFLTDLPQSSVQREITTSSASGMGRSSAVRGTCRVRTAKAATKPLRGPTSAASAAPESTMLSHGSASSAPLDDLSQQASDFLTTNFPHARLASHDEILNRICTPYDSDAFESLLARHNLMEKYPKLVHNLRHGFPMGDFPDLDCTVIFPNHPSALLYEDFVREYLAEEVAASRMSGPFSQQEVETILKGPFQCSPIIISVQSQAPGTPDKLRLCRHLSKANKLHPSTNAYIDKDKFPTRYDSATEVADIIINAPPGTQAMVLDIAKFHRTCPILPEHKRWFVLKGPDGFHIDHVCPFGCSSSSGNAGTIGNAVVDIWKAEGVSPITRIEDDLAPFRSPVRTNPDGSYAYAYDHTDALERISPTRTPWHPTKGQDFASLFVYIGFLWDIENKRVSLPEQKRLKFLERCRRFLRSFSTRQCIMRDVMKIHGSLCHLTFVYPLGRGHLADLSNFITKFDGDEYRPLYPPPSWERTLTTPGVFRQLYARGPLIDRHLFVDASTSWGVGIKVDGEWSAWKLTGDWRSHARHIGWLETIALEFLIYTMEKLDWHDVHLLVHSDNKGVIGAFDKGRSRNFEINLSIRRAHYVLASRNITLKLEYIESARNPADPISRGTLAPYSLRLPYTFLLPLDIASFGVISGKAKADTHDASQTTAAGPVPPQTRVHADPRPSEQTPLTPPPLPFLSRTIGALSRRPAELPAAPMCRPVPDTQPAPTSNPTPPIPPPKKGRKPRAGDAIANNALRPHVAAADRLRTWTSPFGQERDTQFREKFPEDVVNKTYLALFASYEPGTHTNYAASLLRFHQFCDTHKIPERDRMPASHLLLAAFIAEHVGTSSGSTIKSWMSGIKAWHDINGAPWEGEDRWVELARRTANKMGTKFKREQRGPVTIEHLIALRCALKLSSPFDAAVWSLALAAFWGCRRLGELTVPTLEKFDPKYHITRGTPHNRIRSSNAARATTLHIPWTKSTREQGGRLTLTTRGDDFCPEAAFEEHLRVNAKVPDSAPLFAFDAGNGKWSPMTKDFFLRRCMDIWAKAKMARVHGHSFRIGGSTELLLAGVAPEIVASLGGWTSLAFLLYWRKLEHILPLNIGRAYDKKKLDDVAKALEAFRIANGITIAVVNLDEI
ncbi:hypothetical protein MSAN_02447600 [Mycena sanguinolenta]|uniref:Uncharacterized protein n=1 Tax=Mycena sanguinolenta TaxID=230812 RepID=A0A8H6WY27_9AGAR|nr:hypothetical protein MSAN_02447600 [Mycena sanguinolenta]